MNIENVRTMSIVEQFDRHFWWPNWPSSNQAIFCNTSNGGGGLLQPPLRIFANEPPMSLVLILIDIDLLYKYIPKRVQSVKALRSYDVIKHGGTWKLRFFVKNIQKLKNFKILL